MTHLDHDLLKRIEDNYMSLSKGQKRIADYIFKNYDKVAFVTASILGETVGVSESTVVRFANALGYEGYPKLQKGLQESIKTKLTTVQRFEMSKGMEMGESSLKKIMNSDMDNIRKTMELIDEKKIQSIVSALHMSRKTFVIGNRSSAVLANYLGFYLNFILDDVHMVPSGSNAAFDQMINISAGDSLVVISFPRYSKSTFDAVNFAKEQGATIVGITDGATSPLAGIVDCCLFARYNMNTFIDSLVAPMSLINALIIALSLNEKERVENKFKQLETIWQKYEIYNPK